jgi:hypothetical protein
MAVSVKAAVFWDVAPCSVVDHSFGGAYGLHVQGKPSVEIEVLDLWVFLPLLNTHLYII